VPTPTDADARRTRFKRLHEAGCFVLPNAWDAGSARYLEHLGAAAIATTSGGFAFSHGLPDSEEAITLDMVLAHLGEIAEAVSIPVNVDFQSGYARDPSAVAENVARCIDVGASGISIEDLSTDGDGSLYELSLAVERIEATRAVIDAHGPGVVLTARAEPFVARMEEPLNEAIRRLSAYAAAGADVVYTPGPQDLRSIRTIVEAVSPTPVNVLIGTPVDYDVHVLEQLGVRRVSVGSALARSAWGAFDRAARQLLDGSFSGLDAAIPSAQLNKLFQRPSQT